MMVGWKVGGCTNGESEKIRGSSNYRFEKVGVCIECDFENVEGCTYGGRQ